MVDCWDVAGETKLPVGQEVLDVFTFPGAPLLTYPGHHQPVANVDLSDPSVGRVLDGDP